MSRMGRPRARFRPETRSPRPFGKLRRGAPDAPTLALDRLGPNGLGVSGRKRARRQGTRSNRSRTGIILPIVLVCCLLLSMMVMAFQFLSSSDYKSVARLMRGAQAAALADLASDEIMLLVGDISIGAGATKPTWVTELLQDLEAARSGGGPVLDVTKTLDFTDDVPLTRQAAEKAAKIVEARVVRAIVGPFKRIGGYEKKHHYAEPGFNDSGKLLQSWDLTGPFAVDVAVLSPDGGPLEFSQRYLRSQDLRITDTTPPAAEFALFSFLPPPSEDYAINDMQRGGRLLVNPETNGRVMVRGPLFLLPEDPDPVRAFLGGDQPADSATYPDTSWTNWASIPGPRTLQHPENSTSGVLSGLLAQIGNLLQNIKADTQARRGKFTASYSLFETKPIAVEICFDLPVIGNVCKTIVVPVKRYDLGSGSVVMAAQLMGNTPTYQTIDRDELAYYPPGAHYYAPLAPGKQMFQVLAQQVTVFKGALVEGAENSEPTQFVPGATPPEEGAAVLLEPPPRAGEDAGIMGLYGSAMVNGKTLATMKVYDVAYWLVAKKVAELSGLQKRIAERLGIPAIVNMALAAIELDGNLDVMLRRFSINGPGNWPRNPEDMTSAEIEEKLRNQQGVLTPFGFYRHDDGFWDSPRAPSGKKDELIQAFKTPLLTQSPATILNKVFITDNVTDWSALESMVADPGVDVAADMRDFLTGDHASYLIRNTSGKDAGSQDAAFRAILEQGVKAPGVGLPPLSPARLRRPDGAFGDYGGPPSPASAELATLEGSYPKGFYPSGFRQWEAIATRAYPDVASWLAAEAVNGVVDLKGAVLLRSCNHPGGGGGSGDIAYKGRGIVIVTTEDAAAPATLDGQIRPVAGATNAELILVHRVKRELVETGQLPPLKLGALIFASVYSDTGVTPTGSQTKIVGNLVTGLLNKKNIAASMAPDDGVAVVYRDAVGNAASGSRENYWSLELGGEVSSVEPTS